MAHKPDLRETAKHWRKLLYSRIINIFEYENLPKEINEFAFKLFLFRNGKVIFYKIGDKFLIQPFAYTDLLDWYYVPKNGRVVNPWLPKGHQNKEFELADEAIVYNSTPDRYNFRERGLVSDLIYKTAYQLAENDISYYCIQRNHRLIAVFTAETDIQKAELNRVLERMYNGESEITMGEDLVSHITVNPIAMNSTRSSITELIEFAQYTLANFYHSFGINSNYNLKREQLNSNEIDVNQEVLRLNVEDMLRNREQGVEKINELYNLDLRVRLNEDVYKTLLADLESCGQPEEGKSVETSQSETFETDTQKGNGDGKDNEVDSSIRDVQENDTVNNSNISETSEEMGTENRENDNSEEKTKITININTAKELLNSMYGGVYVDTDSVTIEEGDENDESSQSDDVSPEEKADRMGRGKSDD